MILIFGGAYQGKLDYAKKNFDIKTVCDCSDGAVPDFAADAIYGIEALRVFREMNGRLMLRLAAEASEVHRVFCGIGKRVK